MKRSWKNFRIDKSKVYMRLGQAVAYTSMWLAGVTFCYFILTLHKTNSFLNFYSYCLYLLFLFIMLNLIDKKNI